MADNLSVKVSADIIDLTTKFAVARAETSSLSSELNKLARTATTAGMTEELKGQMVSLSEKMLLAQNQTKSLRAELAQGSSGVSSFKVAVSEAKNMLGEFGLALGVGALVEFGRQAFETAAHVEHEAEVLNMTATAYQAYTEAARSAGVSTETVDTAIRKFNASLGAAQTQTGAQADAMRELGVNAFLPTDEALAQVSRSLLNMADTSRRTKLEVELFGRSGAELTPALEKWASGTAAVTKEMQDLGVIMDENTTKHAHEFEVKWTMMLDWMKAKTAETVDTVGEMFDRVGKTTFVAGPGGQMVARYSAPAEPKDENKPNHSGKNNDTLSPTLKQANALASALDTTSSKITELQSKIKELQSAEANPQATQAMKDNYAKAITSAQHQIQSLKQAETRPGERAANQVGEKQIAQTKETISEINANEALGATEREQLINQAYQKLLASDRLTGAQRVTVTTEYNNTLTAEHRRAAAEQAAITKENLDTDLRLRQIGYQQQRAALEAQVTAGLITKQDELAQLIDIAKQESVAEIARIDQSEIGYARDSVAFVRAEDQKKIAAAQTAEEIEKLNLNLAEDGKHTADQQARAWAHSVGEISGAENTLVSDLIGGRKTLGASLASMAVQLAEREIQVDMAGMTERLLLSKAELASDKSTGQMGLLYHLAFEEQKTAITNEAETARTGAVEAGTAERLSKTVTSAASGNAMEKTIGSESVMGDAYKAAAGTYSSVAQIPYVGWIMAPAAAAGAFSAVMAYDMFADGTPYAPGGMAVVGERGPELINIPRGAEVVPNHKILSAVSQNSSVSANSFNSSAASLTYAPQINAPEAATLHQLLSNESSTMLKWINNNIRSGALKVRAA